METPLLAPETNIQVTTPTSGSTTVTSNVVGGGFSLPRQPSAQELTYSARVLQTSGNTLSKQTLKALGLSKEQGKQAIESLKDDRGIRNDFHAKIWSDGNVTHPDTGVVLGNLFDYVD